ncbi:MAG: phosphatidylserine decarboxylase [Thermodesulfovibrio sp.]|nr:phosphatidylserine decarboxylase [Thermodesulfovibrio sp.]
MQHQYVERETGQVKTETFQGDGFINFLYSSLRERSDYLFKILTDAKFTKILSFINYDIPITKKKLKQYIENMNINEEEMLDSIENIKTLRELFERKIRYWEYRPMNDDEGTVVSPCDAKCHVGSLMPNSLFFIKEKFFDTYELLGKLKWFDIFRDGDYAIFRLTPEKYHYNHCPVSGVVDDFYEIEGYYHSCNPLALISIENPYSKNKRVVTIINTNVSGGTKIGYVAMIEVVAMMIGDIAQCYSEYFYDLPKKIKEGIFLKKGQPKSLFRPGSSTTILFFEKNKINFCEDLIKNQKRRDVKSRFSFNLIDRIVETDLKVRSTIGFRI